MTAILRVKLQLQAPVSFENGNAQYDTFTSCRRSSMKLVTASYFLLFFSITGVDTFGGKKKKEKNSETRWLSKYLRVEALPTFIILTNEAKHCVLRLHIMLQITDYLRSSHELTNVRT